MCCSSRHTRSTLGWGYSVLNATCAWDLGLDAIRIPRRAAKLHVKVVLGLGARHHMLRPHTSHGHHDVQPTIHTTQEHEGVRWSASFSAGLVRVISL